MKCIEDDIPFDVPEGWEWTRIFSISNELPYGTAKKSDSSGKVIVLRMGNLQNGEVDYSDLVYSSDATDIEKYNLIQGDLLFNRTNSSEWVGKTSIYRGDFPAIYAGYIIRLRTPLNSEYLNAVMNSSYAYQYCRMVKTDGVNQSNINAQKLGAFLVPVAPAAEQQMIAHKIYDILPQIDSIAKCKKSVEEITSYIKEKVLELAIRGRLVKQNPDDEPASALLEHIRAEKEDLIKQGKLKRDKKESIIYKGDDNSYYEKFANGFAVEVSDIPYYIPDNWCWTRFGTITINRDSERKPISSTDRSDVKKIYDYYGASGKIDKVDNYIFDERLLLIGEDGANLVTRSKPIAFFAEGKYWVNNHAHCIDATDKKLLDYICLYINAINLEKYVTGSAQPKMNQEKMNSILIPMPPAKEQIQIVSKVANYLLLISEIEESLN